MIRVFAVLTISLLLGGLAMAAGIDGKWSMEMTMRGGKDKAKEVTVKTTLDLKSDGAKLTGTVSNDAGGRVRESPVQDGKIEGNKFSFTTTQKTRDGEVKVTWEGTLEGNELKGERKIEGRSRGVPFTAKKQ
jgi:hypothetical protein